MQSVTKARIGVSACLLGEPVRYDGGHKRNGIVCEELACRFELLPVCPEAAAGLGVPRPPVRLVEIDGRIHARGAEEPGLDVTAALEAFAQRYPEGLKGLSGFILKSRSPSCGITDAPLHDMNGNLLRWGSGLFAGSLKKRWPSLPVIDEAGINDASLRREFVDRVLAFHDAKQPILPPNF